MSLLDEISTDGVLALTCARDGLLHLVTETALVDGAEQGVYPALCGHPVLACSLGTDPGPPCGRCRAVRAGSQHGAAAPPRPTPWWRRGPHTCRRRRS